MKPIYERLEREGKIGPMENVSQDPKRIILQPRVGYRSEYPKLVKVGERSDGFPIKRLVHNSHEELMLKASSTEAPTDEAIASQLQAQELASLRQSNRALEEKIQQLLAEKEQSKLPQVNGKVTGKSTNPLDDLLPTAKAQSKLDEFKATL